MPRIHRLSTVKEYRPPDPKTGQLIRKLSLVTSEDLLDIALAPYEARGYVQLAYNVAHPRFRIYHDEFFASFVEQVSDRSRNLLDFSESEASPSSVPCLSFEAMRSPSVIAHEFKFLVGKDLLGGLGVFALSSIEGLKGDHLKIWLGKVAQYHLQSLNPCPNLMISFPTQTEGKWQITFGRINVHKYTITDHASVRFMLVRPGDLIEGHLNGMKLSEVPHEIIDLFIPLLGNMNYYKQ